MTLIIGTRMLINYQAHGLTMFSFLPRFVCQQPDEVVNIAVDKINGLLESFMGINDSELGKAPVLIVFIPQ